MKVVNRGYIYVEPKQAFCDWAKQHDADFDFDESDDLEGNLYLIEEDFFEYEPLIESHLAVVDSDEDYPKPTLDLFLEWFSIRVGSSVFDTQKTDLESDKL
jgi:hypothetical protein